MSMFDKYSKKPPEVFQRMVGLSLGTFNVLQDKLQVAYSDYLNEQLTRKRGKRNKMSLQDQLLMTLLYLRSYDTLLNIGFQFNISESYAQKRFTFIKMLLLRCLDLPDELALKQAIKGDYVAIDVTEQVIERPLENQNDYYSGKKTSYN
jgi:hypothetical protein